MGRVNTKDHHLLGCDWLDENLGQSALVLGGSHTHM